MALRPLLLLSGFGAVATSLAACAVGPNYSPPKAPGVESLAQPPKEATGWVPAEPMDGMPRGPWWTTFKDADLDRLEGQLAAANQTLKAQDAIYRQARAVVEETQSGVFPVIGYQGSGQRSGGGSGASTTLLPGKTFSAAASASWTLDFWGKIRRQVEQSRAEAQASAADLATVRLSLHAELAADYLTLRAEDEQIGLLVRAEIAAERIAHDTANQYRAGVAQRSDVIAAESAEASAHAAVFDAKASRAVYEHAIAVLVGAPPEGFSLPPGALTAHAPDASVAIVSTLLQRRPDVASAERAAAAASAGIGIARAAWFPSVSLSASDTSTSAIFSKLLSSPTTVWAYGASASGTLLDFGGRQGADRAARAAYEQQAAIYRNTVLAALQNVEDQVAKLRALEAEAPLLQADLDRAKQAEQIARNQYAAGTLAYGAVAQAESARYTVEEALLTLRLNRALASLGLIQALGGGWTSADLPRF